MDLSKRVGRWPCLYWLDWGVSALLVLVGLRLDLLLPLAYPQVLLAAASQAQEVEATAVWDLEVAANMVVVQVLECSGEVAQERRGIVAERGHIAAVLPSGPVSGTGPLHPRSLGVPSAAPAAVLVLALVGFVFVEVSVCALLLVILLGLPVPLMHPSRRSDCR